VLSENDRILITGGAGLIGSHIADLLVKQYNPEIIILDNFTTGRRENLRWVFTHGRVEVFEGDIRDAGIVHDAMSGVDVVFHQAAISRGQCADDPRLGMEVLVDGTFNVLEAAALNRIKKVVAASCGSVYGLADDFPTTETHHLNNARTLYGAAKGFNESLLRTFYDMYGMNYVALRYFNVYGPRMDVHGAYTEVLMRWMKRLAQRQPCVVLGDGTETMDLVYVEDVARATVLAAESDITDEVFNIATGVETTLNGLAATLGQVMGSSIAPEYGPRRRGNTLPRRVADISKAERMLGFHPQVSLEDGLTRLVSWWERQRALETAIA
jgi:UDP-glucose 4-epimerase